MSTQSSSMMKIYVHLQNKCLTNSKFRMLIKYTSMTKYTKFVTKYTKFVHRNIYQKVQNICKLF